MTLKTKQTRFFISQVGTLEDLSNSDGLGAICHLTPHYIFINIDTLINDKSTRSHTQIENTKSITDDIMNVIIVIIQVQETANLNRFQ